MSTRKRWCLISLIVSLGALSAIGAPAGETRLLRYPDISDSGIVFVYGGDLWTVGLDGGVARKLTTHAGYEIFPKFSPDGKNIAFSAQYDGNIDAFVIPAAGGVPQRLTFHPGNDRVVDWFPDGSRILTRSRAASWKERFERYFSIPLSGGQPDLLPLPEAGPASFSPDGSRLAFNLPSIEFRTWKRYRGGMDPVIWIYDFARNTAEKITGNECINQFPMWYKDRIYFASDRDHTMNLFCYDLKTKKTEKVTNHSEYDVNWPSIGGDRIVYENGGWLWVLDLRDHKTRRLSIQAPDDGLNSRPRIMGVEKFVQGGGISPTGKRVVVAARGDIFTLPAEKGNGRNLTGTPDVREKDPIWSPDGKWIAYYGDRTGEYEIYLRQADGKGEETRVTTDGTCYRNRMKWSPDSKKLLFSDSRMNFYYVDIDQKTPVLFDQDPFGHTPTDFAWSGDSNWIAYGKNTAKNLSTIFLYSVKDKKSTPVGPGNTSDTNPAFDREGKYLYFASQRNFEPTFSEFDGSFVYRNTTGIFSATLQKDEVSPLAPESDEEEAKTDKAEKKDDAKPAEGEPKKDEQAAADSGSTAAGNDADKKDVKKDEKKDEKKEWKIDLEGLSDRAVCLPIPAGVYGDLQAGDGALLYMAYDPDANRDDDSDGGATGTVMAYDLKKRESKDVISGVMGYDLSADGKKLVYLGPGGMIGIVDAKPGAGKAGAGKINTAELRMNVVPLAEWTQIFHDAWRQERDFFYDPNMHGVDWKKMKDRYEQLIPYCAHRDDLNYLLGELLGELDCGHTYVGGGDMPRLEPVRIGLLGAEIEPDREHKRYRIGKIFQGENWDKRRLSPLAQPGLKIKTGDYVLAVDGQPVAWPANFYGFFVDTVGKQVRLTVNDKPAMEGSWEVVVQPTGDEQQLRYLDQVEANRAFVDKATGGKVGYIHVPSTGVDGLNEFYKGFLAQFDKEGLIVDVRYNNGGMIPDRFIEILRRPLMSFWGTQHSQGFTTPQRATPPHLVCVINSYAGSGGDAFPYYFKQAGLGPLIGTRTWGGLVGISRGMPFTDGGGVTMPDFGVYSTDGRWVVENHGVDPDIEVENTPDQVIAGHDQQLDKAIAVILDSIRKNPVSTPPKPPYPVKN